MAVSRDRALSPTSHIDVSVDTADASSDIRVYTTFTRSPAAVLVILYINLAIYVRKRQ